MKLEKCKICGINFSQISGHFTIHLKNEHNMTLEDYIVHTEYNNIHPKCQCGYCDDDATFNLRTRKFSHINNEHRKFDWLKEQKILKDGIPKCKTCGGDVKWKRGIPNQYCSFKCLPNNWNQEKVKQTVIEKYGVDNIFKNEDIKKKIKESLVSKRKEMAAKCNETKKLKYKNGAFDVEKMKETIMRNYGVEHVSQISKNRIGSSKRMKLNNPMYSDEIASKVSQTLVKNILSGKTRAFNSQKYMDTNLYYQSSYEKHFLDLCKEIRIIEKVKNGNVYEYLADDKHHGHRLLTDFSLENVEIEIKSNWILQKQGGKETIDAKRRAVEFLGKKYIFILEKNYSEFLLYIINNEIKPTI